jgi:predicted nucleic acid-binding protein
LGERTSLKAAEVYVDPSGLARLYIHQAGSREMSAWRGRISGTLAVTHHGRVEIINAICRAAFVGHLSEKAASEALADFVADFAEGRLRQAEILWRAALNRAAALAQSHTPRLGTRSLDVLHVACALELKSRHFLTFDERQQKLASAVGLKTILL